MEKQKVDVIEVDKDGKNTFSPDGPYGKKYWIKHPSAFGQIRKARLLISKKSVIPVFATLGFSILFLLPLGLTLNTVLEKKYGKSALIEFTLVCVFQVILCAPIVWLLYVSITGHDRLDKILKPIELKPSKQSRWQKLVPFLFAVLFCLRFILGNPFFHGPYKPRIILFFAAGMALTVLLAIYKIRKTHRKS